MSPAVARSAISSGRRPPSWKRTATTPWRPSPKRSTRWTPCAPRRAADGGPRVYALASSIVDLAGYFDTGPLFDAAYSLCDVSDRMIHAETWHWPSVRVHAQALRLILANGCRVGRTSETLLAGLRSITQSR